MSIIFRSNAYSFSCRGENADFWQLTHWVNLIPAGCHGNLPATSPGKWHKCNDRPGPTGADARELHWCEAMRNDQLTFACSRNDSTMRRSIRDGLTGNGGIGMQLALDIILPGFWRANSASVCWAISFQQTHVQYNTLFTTSKKTKSSSTDGTSGVVRWGLEGGQLRPGAVDEGRRGGAKLPHQKCFNGNKSEFDEVCWMSQQ